MCVCVHGAFSIYFSAIVFFFLFMVGLLWFGFFVQRNINLCRLFNAKAISQRGKEGLKEDWFHTFPMGISHEVNRIARREFELPYKIFTAQHINHSTTMTHPVVFFFGVCSDFFIALFKELFVLCLNCNCCQILVSFRYLYLPNTFPTNRIHSQFSIQLV